MKKILVRCMLTIIVSACLFSCSTSSNSDDTESEASAAKAKLKTLIRKIDFPQYVDSTTVLKNMYIADGALVSVIEIPAERLGTLNTDSLKAYNMNKLRNGSTAKKLARIASDAKLKLRYVYRAGEDSVQVEIAPDQL